MKKFNYMFRDARMHYLLMMLAMISSRSIAQNGVSRWISEIKSTQKFERIEMVQSAAGNAAMERASIQGKILQLSNGTLEQISVAKPSAIRLKLSTPDSETLEVILGKVDILAPGFRIGTLGADPVSNFTWDEAAFYRGIVDRNEKSIATFSFYKNELSGFISTSEGQFELVTIPGNEKEILIYDVKELRTKPAFDCGVENIPSKPKQENGNQTDGVACKTVSIYLECDYKLYTDKGSNVTNVTNYVTGLFNQVATLYANENIAVQISSINVWTTTDPYASYSSTADLLPAFRTTRGTNFTGTLAHFLTTRNVGGGRAYLDVLCTKSYAHGVSYIYNSYSTVPTYSWTVEVVTHELGHNFGSSHTQACSWPLAGGGTGALDNCYTTEGGCPAGPAPVNGGTIMSYCHLTSYGINFANGFGPQPGDLIRNRVINASCISSSGTAPSGLSSSNITTSEATLSWLAVAGAITYTVEYKMSSATTWTSAGTTSSTSMNLTGLSSGTTYNWRVRTDCSSNSTTANFTTTSTSTCTAPTNLTTTSITSSGAVLGWGSVSGASNYTVQYKTSSATTWTTAAAVSTNSLTLTGLVSGTTYNWKVQANCSGFSSTANFTTSSSGCATPTGMQTTNITSNGATLSWNPMQGALNYTVRYKKKAGNKWISVGPVSSSSINLTGLSSGTNYEWRVKTNCSNFTASTLFTTPAALIAENNTSKAIDPLIVYPNPAREVLLIQLREGIDVSSPMELIITDMLGKIRITQILSNDLERIDISGLSSGFYVAQVISPEGKVQNKKFLKE